VSHPRKPEQQIRSHKFNIENKIFVISVLGLGDVVFDSVWGVIPPPTKETLLEIRGGNFFTA